MDRDFLKTKYSGIMGNLGPFGSMVAAAASSIAVPMKAGDVEGTRARAVEGKEFAAAFDTFCDNVIEDLADDKLTVAELGELIDELAGVADEAEDVVTGVDEDDPPAVD